MWEINYENIDYKIIHIKKQTRGNGFYLEVRAKPLFYWDFDKSIIHPNFNGSMTAVACFTRLFEGTGYNFSIINPSPAVSWEGFGKGSTRLELFKRAIDRYNYEFYIEGKTVYLRHLIGNDTNFMYKYKLNASNVSENIDASGMFTHIKGFGNFEEGEEDYYSNAKLKREYTSPLADVVGFSEGKPIVDGRVSVVETMDAALIKAVEESLAITIEGTLHDVRKMGYVAAVPLKGDRVWLHDERINLEREIRLHSVTTTYDEKENITACDVTFGSQSIRDRHKSNLNAMAQAISDLLDGKIELPYDILAPRAKEMLEKLMSVDTELVLDNGIFAVDPNNPNNIVGLNSAGWFISTDGGATAETIATAEGILANSITSGELLTHLVRIVGAEGFMWMDGDEFVAMNPLDDTQFVRINPKTGLTVSKSNLQILSGTGENAVTVWDSAEDNAKLHADTVAGTAESNAKNHADEVGESTANTIRNELQMTSALPNEIELSQNGITAYTRTDDRYARLDHRGLYVHNGAIAIRRDDGPIWMESGKQKFGVPIITEINMDEGVEFTRRNFETSNSHFSLFKAGYTEHAGRWANFGFLAGLTWDSNSSSAHIEVEIEATNAPAGVTIPKGLHRQIIYRDQQTSGFTINIPLPPPTWAALTFVLRFRLDSRYSGNKATIRDTRKWISG